MEMKKKRKKGSGRTKGAVSFVRVTLKDLNRVLRENASVLVSRKYAEQLELNSEGVKIGMTTAKQMVKGFTKNRIKAKIQKSKPIE